MDVPGIKFNANWQGLAKWDIRVKNLDLGKKHFTLLREALRKRRNEQRSSALPASCDAACSGFIASLQKLGTRLLAQAPDVPERHHVTCALRRAVSPSVSPVLHM